MRTILVTGAAGFIGSWVAEALLTRGDHVIGVDNYNTYYDVALKRARADRLKKAGLSIIEADVSDKAAMTALFKKNRIDQICHLAAQAGVRYSIQNPYVYEIANNLGTLTLLEMCKEFKVPSMILASSSSVYGGNTKTPFSVGDHVDHPISLYAATKRYNELIAYTYHHLYGIHCTVLRFFTVYGPWGRPDMALFKFTKAILEGKPIEVYNNGKMKRDFTFVTDIVQGVLAALDKDYPYEIFNLGNSKTVELKYFIECVEKELGKKAERKLLPLQAGDVLETSADIEISRAKLGFSPRVDIEQGIHEFVVWYNASHHLLTPTT